jgi:hypothetical protein
MEIKTISFNANNVSDGIQDYKSNIFIVKIAIDALLAKKKIFIIVNIAKYATRKKKKNHFIAIIAINALIHNMNFIVIFVKHV